MAFSADPSTGKILTYMRAERNSTTDKCDFVCTDFSKFYNGIQKAKQVESMCHSMYEKITSMNILLAGNRCQIPHQGKEYTIRYQGSFKDGCSLPRNFIRSKDCKVLQVEIDRAHFIGEITQKDLANVQEIAGSSHAQVLNNEMAKHYFMDYYQASYEDGIHGKYINSESVREHIFYRSRVIQKKHYKCIESLMILILADEHAKIIIPEGADRDPSAKIAHTVSINIYSETLSGKLDMDNVSLLKLAFWPQSAQEWVKDGKWPGKEDRKQIIQEHSCSLVPVTSNDEAAQTEWRYSFSDIESHIMSLLFQADDNHCYLAYFLFKALYYRFIKSKYDSEVDVIPSYMIKTTLLLVSEDHPPEDVCWEDPKVGLMKLLEKLHDCLCHRNMPHYFLPKVNILQKVLDYGESLCLILSEQVGDIIKNLDEHLDDIYLDFDEITTKALTLMVKVYNFAEVFLDMLLRHLLTFLLNDDYDDSLFQTYNELANIKGITPLDSKFSATFKMFCMEIKRAFIHQSE